MEQENKKDLLATVHVPVLLQDVISTLSIEKDDYVVDCTLGGAGYTKAILARLGEEGRLLAIDADESALERAKVVLGDEDRVTFAKGNFRNIDMFVKEAGLERVNKIVADLGLSSDHLEAKSGRGFSFMIDEPLKMTFALAPEKGELTAWHVVNEWSEETLADIIFGFGGDRGAKKIARAITEAREEKSIETSKELAEVIERVVFRRGKTHPATKTFQAIRMAVNDELGALEEMLRKSKELLSPNGRITVVSFHSLEDRVVKQAFAAWEKEGFGKRVMKHPVSPTRKECLENRRARSAKLRCFERYDA